MKNLYFALWIARMLCLPWTLFCWTAGYLCLWIGNKERPSFLDIFWLPVQLPVAGVAWLLEPLFKSR